jgi:hypothetical protein
VNTQQLTDEQYQTEIALIKKLKEDEYDRLNRNERIKEDDEMNKIVPAEQKVFEARRRELNEGKIRADSDEIETTNEILDGIGKELARI